MAIRENGKQIGAFGDRDGGVAGLRTRLDETNSNHTKDVEPGALIHAFGGVASLMLHVDPQRYAQQVAGVGMHEVAATFLAGHQDQATDPDSQPTRAELAGKALVMWFAEWTNTLTNRT